MNGGGRKEPIRYYPRAPNGKPKKEKKTRRMKIKILGTYRKNPGKGDSDVKKLGLMENLR